MKEDEKIIGIIDEPIKPYLNSDTNDQSDRLGVADYANALGEFIKKTNTPMTIGIQGEWGSGKTSLLNNLMNLLDGVSKNTTFECIWVNTWEHSLLKTPEEALISIVTDISHQITLLNKDNKMAGQITATGKKLLSGAVRIAAGMTMGMAGQEVAGELLESKADNSIRKLREDLEDFIDKLVNDEKTQEIKNIKKIVFFIDDLDRIEPKDAVKVLELLKNIFSIKHCVFVLAIDYQVIIKGLKDKFGEKTDENEREFRSFFDKIIQLPFTMPTSQYRVAEYVEGLLHKIGFVSKNEKFNIKIVNEILENTIGSNPRAIKRLINNLSLLNILEEIKKQKLTKKISIDEKLLEFALVCCQVAYPKIYELISLKPEIEQWDDDFAATITEKKEEQDAKFAHALQSVSQTDDFDEKWEKALFRIAYSYSDMRNQATKISRFLNLFVEEEKIKYNTEQLINILNSTSATVVTANDQNKFKKPEARQTLENQNDFEMSLKAFALDDGLDEILIDNRIKASQIFINTLKNFLIENKKDFKLDLNRESVVFKVFNGKKYLKFCHFYPMGINKDMDKSGKMFHINLRKDHLKDFKIPIIDNETYGSNPRKFHTNLSYWKYSFEYQLHFTEESFEKNKDKILGLFLRSCEIIANNEPQLEEVRLNTLTGPELKQLEIRGMDNHTFNP